MDWSTIGNIAGGAASIAGGGIFGLIGSVFGQVSKYFQRKQEMAWQEKKWEYETNLLQLRMKAKAEETEQELALVSQRGAWAGLNSSVSADAALKPLSPWAVNLKSLFRPFVTVLLWGIAAWVFYQLVSGSMQKWFEQTEIRDLVKYMVYSIFFTASSATLWWFGDRALTPPDLKNR